MNLRHTLKTLGPGLLWAGAAIGVSHLVQSTRAGASYGFELVWLVILANLFKYPFFEFGPRYASATGQNLLIGYRKLGNWAIPLYLLITWLTMFSIQAAVTVVTASLFASITGVLNTAYWTYILLLAGALVVVLGNYSVLDKLIKLIIIVLTLSTLLAVVLALGHGYAPQAEFAKHFSWASVADIGFLIALAGWMPSAIDISVWHSVWTTAKAESSGYRATVKESLFDFNVGYIGTAILSLAFLSLGALIMYGTGNQFSDAAAAFASELMSLFTSSLGNWAYPLIAVAALTTMISTTLTVLDAIPRVLTEASVQWRPAWAEAKVKKRILWVWLVILVAGSSAIVLFLLGSLKVFVDVATILSFLTAPILGWMNYKVVTSPDMPAEHRPPMWLRVLSYVGLIVLVAFSLYYLVQRFML